MNNYYSICHDSTSKIEDWIDFIGEDKSIGFDHPGFFLEYLKTNREQLEDKNNIFIFDRWWCQKIDMVKDPMIKQIRDECEGLSVTWVLSSNDHKLGDKIKGWDLVMSGKVLFESELLELLNSER